MENGLSRTMDRLWTMDHAWIMLQNSMVKSGTCSGFLHELSGGEICHSRSCSWSSILEQYPTTRVFVSGT